MARSAEAPLNPEEIFEAFQTLATETVQVFQSYERTNERMLTLGNYMIVCAIGTPHPDPEAYEFVFRGGLLLAGLDGPDTETLHRFSQRSDMVRYVYSLSYVPDSMDVPGIVRRPKSVTLRETSFVRGILAKRSNV